MVSALLREAVAFFWVETISSRSEWAELFMPFLYSHPHKMPHKLLHHSLADRPCPTHSVHNVSGHFTPLGLLLYQWLGLRWHWQCPGLVRLSHKHCQLKTCVSALLVFSCLMKISGNSLYSENYCSAAGWASSGAALFTNWKHAPSKSQRNRLRPVGLPPSNHGILP